MANLYYGITGDGRAASHLCEYFRLLEIPFINWNRKEDSLAPEKKLADCDVIILAVSDGVVKEMAVSFSASGKTLVHLSGANSYEGVTGCHPLMSFPRELFSLKEYRQIPFVMDADGPEWEQLFPDLPNPHVRLEKEKKSLYHAWCVMAGNFSTLLWQKAASVFNSELGLSPDLLKPYANRVRGSFLQQGEDVLTGPLVRGDKMTIEKNKSELEDHWKSVYNAFELVFSSDSVFGRATE